MALRALMVDVDGVLVRPPLGTRWDDSLAEDLGIDPARLHAAFFAPHFLDVAIGRADLVERLGPVLAEIAPGVRATELMEYWFRQDASIDTELLRDVRDVRAAGLEVHLATVQEHHRARYLWESLGLGADFDGMHYSADLGHKKDDPRFYAGIEHRTSLLPEELLLIDDRQENVEAATAAGWRAVLWTPTSTLNAVLASDSWPPIDDVRG